eukprot:gene14814-14948_t
MFQFPLLVCDIGGTNARFGLIRVPNGPLEIIARLATADFAGLAEAIAEALKGRDIKVNSVIACGAGPVNGVTLKLTNAPWLMKGPDIAKAAGLTYGLLLNDFEAQALSLPAMRPEWLHVIGPQIEAGSGPRLILGPGTGLGIGALLETDGRHVPISSEACHIDFGPVGADEEHFWPHLERVFDRITTESVMNGAGLIRIHKARSLARGHAAPTLDGPSIVAKALADARSNEAQTIAAYWKIIARFSGDMAITFAATGGVTLAGGILPRIINLLDAAGFRATFERKAPVAGLAKRVGSALLINPDAVLYGMAAIGAKPQTYAIDYAARAWI